MRKLFLIVAAAFALYPQTAKFPTAIVTDAELLVAKDRVATTLAVAITTVTQTSIQVASGTGFVANMVITISGSERVKVCNVVGNVFTVGHTSCPNVDGRGFDGSTAATHAIGMSVRGQMTAWHHNALRAEVKAIETAVADARAYNFPAQTPGGSLTASVPATITLTPCPLGVAGANTNHYLYVSAGTGTAEAVLITGGTCTSGLSTGTVQFTPANNHTGAWTIGSATAGGQEALYAGGHFANVEYAQGQVDLQAPLTFTHNYQRIAGVGSDTSFLQAKFSGSWIVAPSGTLNPTVEDLGLLADPAVPQASGAAIDFQNGNFYQLRRLWIRRGYYGVRTWNGTDTATVSGAGMVESLKIDDSVSVGASLTQVVASDIKIENAADTGSIGLLVDFCDGCNFTNVIIGGKFPTSALYVGTGATNARIYNTKFTNLQIDSFTGKGIWLTGTKEIYGVDFVNIHVATQNAAAAQPAIQIDATAGGTRHISFMGGKIVDIRRSGIVNAASTLRIHGVYFLNIGLDSAGTYSVIDHTSGGSLSAIGCRISKRIAADTVTAKHFVQYAAAPYSGEQIITGNDIVNVTDVPVKATGTTWAAGALVRIENNAGIDTSIPTVASGATVTLGDNVNPAIKITGTTQITTLNGGWIGRVVALIFTDASPGGVGTGGNIARTQAAAQNQAITLRFDGTNWY